jgi:hypothetical protein
MMFRDARKDQFEWRNTIAPLLGDWVVLLAMKHRRAPLPVSSALWKGLLRKGFPNDLDELATFARRYLFLGDERLLLTELRIRTVTTSPVRETWSKESEIVAEKHPQTTRSAQPHLDWRIDGECRPGTSRSGDDRVHFSRRSPALNLNRPYGTLEKHRR